MKMKHNVGIFLLDGLLYKGRGKFNNKYIVEENSLDYLWCKQFIPDDDLITYKYIGKSSCNDPFFVKILRNTNLLSQLKEKGIQTIFNPHKGHKYIQDWEKKNKIKVISTAINWQIRLENKIWFDRFLSENKIPKPRSKVCRVHEFDENWDKIVVQKADSYAGEGTYIIPDKSKLSKLSKSAINLDDYYLFREFVTGKPYGICVFIVPGIVALSSIRLQCYLKPQPGVRNKTFAGIQWIPYSALSRKAIINVNKIFKKIGDLLYKKQVYGFINFDFIINASDDVYIIECNPRQSSATFQLTSNHELISGIDTLDCFVNIGKYQIKYVLYPLPEVEFKGSVLDIEFVPDKRSDKKHIQKHQSGLYVYSDKFKLRSIDITRPMNSENEFIYYSNIKSESRISEPTTTGKIISDFELFDASGQLNQKGRRIINYFKY